MTTDHTKAALVLALLLTAATGSARAQGPAAGPEPRSTVLSDERYRLVTIAGKPLPAVVEQERSCREEVTQGTLMLGADSLWSLHLATREICGDRTEQESDTDGGRYDRDGSKIRFHDDDGDDDRDGSRGGDIDLDDLKTGAVSTGGVLTVQLEDGKTSLVFRK